MSRLIKHPQEFLPSSCDPFSLEKEAHRASIDSALEVPGTPGTLHPSAARHACAANTAVARRISNGTAHCHPGAVRQTHWAWQRMPCLRYRLLTLEQTHPAPPFLRRPVFHWDQTLPEPAPQHPDPSLAAPISNEHLHHL